MPRSKEWSSRATSYQRPSYRARSNGVTAVMPEGGVVEEQPTSASTSAVDTSSTERRTQGNSKDMNYQSVTKQTEW